MAEVKNKSVGGPLWTGIKSTLRSRIMAGLVLFIPIWITIFMVKFVFGLMRDASWWVMREVLLTPWGQSFLEQWQVLPDDLRKKGFEVLPSGPWWTFTIACIVLTVVLLYLLGLFTTNVFGGRLVAVGEGMVNRVPFVKTIYSASKQMLQTVAGEGGQSFQKVILAPYPSREVRTIGFVTKTTTDAGTGELVYTVFVATVPNPTTGFVFLVRERDAIVLDWSVEQAVQVVMSCGVMMPASVPLTPTEVKPGLNYIGS